MTKLSDPPGFKVAESCESHSFWGLMLSSSQLTIHWEMLCFMISMKHFALPWLTKKIQKDSCKVWKLLQCNSPPEKNHTILWVNGKMLGVICVAFTCYWHVPSVWMLQLWSTESCWPRTEEHNIQSVARMKVCQFFLIWSQLQFHLADCKSRFLVVLFILIFTFSNTRHTIIKTQMCTFW